MTSPVHSHVISAFAFSSIQPILSKEVRQLRCTYECPNLVFEVCIQDLRSHKENFLDVFASFSTRLYEEWYLVFRSKILRLSHADFSLFLFVLEVSN
jgi:hypothetical protein